MGYNYEVAGEELAKTFEKFAQMSKERADLENKIVLSTYERRQKLNDEEAKYKRDREAKKEDRDHLDPLKQVQLEIQKRKLKDMEALDGLFSQEFGQSKMPNFSLSGAMAQDGGMAAPTEAQVSPRFENPPLPMPQSKKSTKTPSHKDAYSLAVKMANDKYGVTDKRTGKRPPVSLDKIKEFLPVAKKFLESGEMDESLLPQPPEATVKGKEAPMTYAPGAEPDALTPQAVGPNDIRAKRFPNKFKYYPETEQERAGKTPDKFGFRVGTIKTTPKGRFRYIGNNIWSIVK